MPVVQLQHRIDGLVQLALVSEIRKVDAAIAVIESIAPGNAALHGTEERGLAIDEVVARQAEEVVHRAGARLRMLVETRACARCVVHAPVGLDAERCRNARAPAQGALELRRPESHLAVDLRVGKTGRVRALRVAGHGFDQRVVAIGNACDEQDAIGERVGRDGRIALLDDGIVRVGFALGLGKALPVERQAPAARRHDILAERIEGWVAAATDGTGVGCRCQHGQRKGGGE